VWSAQRVVPVRVTEFSLTEEAFDPQLNPIRAKLSIGLRVLSVEDLPFSHKGSTVFLGYLQRKDCCGKAPSPGLAALASEASHERRAEDARRDPAKLAAGPRSTRRIAATTACRRRR